MEQTQPLASRPAGQPAAAVVSKVTEQGGGDSLLGFSIFAFLGAAAAFAIQLIGYLGM